MSNPTIPSTDNNAEQATKPTVDKASTTAKTAEPVKKPAVQRKATQTEQPVVFFPSRRVWPD